MSLRSISACAKLRHFGFLNINILCPKQAIGWNLRHGGSAEDRTDIVNALQATAPHLIHSSLHAARRGQSAAGSERRQGAGERRDKDRIERIAFSNASISAALLINAGVTRMQAPLAGPSRWTVKIRYSSSIFLAIAILS